MKYLTLSLAVLAICVPSLAVAQTPVIKEVSVRSTHTLQGPELYTEYCAVCHGTDGKGAGPAATALKNRPSDLTLLARKNGGKFDAIAIQRVISGSDVVAAHGSRDMPTWGTVFASLSKDESMRTLRLNALVTQIEKIQVK